MKAAPGAIIAPENVIGRNEIISNIWEKLANQSVLLTAERRIGKTTILKKMETEAPQEFLSFYQDLEGISTPQEFTDSVGKKLSSKFGVKARALYETNKALNRLSGAEAQGVKIPDKAEKNWKLELINHITGVKLEQNQKLVFFWDELPLMLHDICERTSYDECMEVFDALRKLRQEYEVRMVLTGSIGVHHVLKSLKEKGYTNDPTNDLIKIDVPALKRKDTIELCKRLISGERLTADDTEKAAAVISELTGDIPYYVHLLIVDLKSKGTRVEETVCKEIVEQALLSAVDPWNLKHFEERIHNYYTKNYTDLAILILNILCSEQGVISFQDIYNKLQAHTSSSTKTHVKTVLLYLELDHYLKGNLQEGYEFRSKILKRWWQGQLV